MSNPFERAASLSEAYEAQIKHLARMNQDASDEEQLRRDYMAGKIDTLEFIMKVEQVIELDEA